MAMNVNFFQQDLFPIIEPYRKGMLSVGDGHKIYWEQSGNPNGQPVVFFHGGPGAGSNPVHRRFFDPRYYQIIIFDQRGAGRSLPLANLINNSTDYLLKDIELLRNHLNIKKWLIFGGSWGSTLALVYGIKHADRCNGFILRGIFLGDTSELDWFLYGIRNIYPEPWNLFTSFLSNEEQGDLIDSYYRRLINPDPSVHMLAAKAWCQYESQCSVLDVNFQNIKQPSDFINKKALALARIEVHYFRNGMFIDDGYIIHNISAVHGIPATIIQGRYDIICPIITADKLSNAWPGSNYIIVPNTGHSALEKSTRHELVKSTEKFKSYLTK
jgi:proline iminopeptidase